MQHDARPHDSRPGLNRPPQRQNAEEPRDGAAPLQQWLINAVQETDTDDFRLKVAGEAHRLGAAGTTADLARRLRDWKIDIKSGGRPVGLYIPRLVLERQLHAVAPDLVVHRDDQHPSGKARFAEAGDRLHHEPSLSTEWLSLTAAFGKTFTNHIRASHGATRIRLFRGIRTAAAPKVLGMTVRDRFLWAHRELAHGTVENWTPAAGVAEGALCDMPGVIIGAEFDAGAVVCTHTIGAETNVTPWRVDGGRVLRTFRYTSIDARV
ncbi:hypothetical protein GS504_01560 [Rhodococcus hoagii]|nr:hypothetical protein [Prescottella equi]NKS71640.1 hypothetical protein [Prescottella equi]